MRKLTYNALKREFQNSKISFKHSYGCDDSIGKAVISVLAHAKYDNGWPLEMLHELSPNLADALKDWSANGYEKIRTAQEADNTASLNHAIFLESEFFLLPIWHGTVRHYSKDLSWYNRLKAGQLQLQSFMGCCSNGHTFAYALNYAVILEFTNLKSARLVGALTTENCEGEVLLPKGSIFRVVSVDHNSSTIYLEEK